MFEKIFLSRKLVEARQSLILVVRNRIAHAEPNLASDAGAIQEYVIDTKHMLKQMQPYLPK
jgi:hypothetical protein